MRLGLIPDLSESFGRPIILIYLPVTGISVDKILSLNALP